MLKALYLFILLPLLLISCNGGRFSATNPDAYKTAKDFINQKIVKTEETGDIKEIRFTFSKLEQERAYDSDGRPQDLSKRMKYEMVLAGDEGELDAEIYLKKTKNNQWKVDSFKTIETEKDLF